jgi:hypothetical protein
MKSRTELGLTAPAMPSDLDSSKTKVEESFSPNEPEPEVGGRDMRNGVYPSYWHTGVYVWWRDGETYRGPHWHPRSYSPVAFDLDDE